jgi:hypothetical protein
VPERNYEWRSIPEVADIEVTRDGDIKFKGRERYDIGSVVDLDGTRMSIQMLISRAFPDIPMRFTPTW